MNRRWLIIPTVVFLGALVAALFFLLLRGEDDREQIRALDPTPAAIQPTITSLAESIEETASTRIAVPPFTLQPGESKTITIAPEQAGKMQFTFKSTEPIELQILYGGELIFLNRCELRNAPGEPSRPFTSLVYQPLDVSRKKPGEFTFTNNCEAPPLQVNASYSLTPAS